MSRVMILLMISIIVLTGCWDYKEIEDIGFLLGVGIDPVGETEENQEGNADHGRMEDEHGHPSKFRITYQIAIPEDLQTEAEGGDGGQGQAYFNVTSTGHTNLNITRHHSAKVSRDINAEHMKVIIINEELARQEGTIEHLIDLLVRDHEMRRGMYVFISKGEAKSILDVQLPLEDMPSLYINMLNENYPGVLQMREPMLMGDLSERVIGKRSYLIPRITGEGEDIKLAGAAIFKGVDNRMLGWLGERDMDGYSWIVGEAGNGVMEVNFEDKGTLVFETTELDESIHYERKGEEDYFHVHIKTEGTLTESWLHGVEIDNTDTMQSMETAIAQEIEAEARNVVDKMQHEFHADVFDFKQFVSRKEYDYWKEVQENWDGEEGKFSQAHVRITAEVHLHHYMLQEKLEE